MTSPLARARAAIGRPVKSALRRLGYDLVRHVDAEPKVLPLDVIPEDCDDATIAIIERIRGYTLTSPERVMALVDSLRYVVRAGVPGAIVECGVWRGGSMMAAALTLLDEGAADRHIYMFDTFTHMPDPDDVDVDMWGVRAADLMPVNTKDPYYAYLPFEDVRKALLSTGYPDELLHFVPGMVEDTLPGEAPPEIAFCRLDTDWYVSTAHEMEHLYPRISKGGVLLVDDYGHFLGARKAVDEYFDKHNQPVLLNRIDYSGRLVVVS